MSETFRKGQLVPRRLRSAITSDKRAQHCIRFGSDTIVMGREYRPANPGDNICFYVSKMGRKMNNGTYKKVGLLIIDVNLIGWETENWESTDNGY